MPVFSMTDAIREYVFVEVPTDLDKDGARDLVRITIIRPAQSGNPETDPTKIRVPVFMSASPYNGTGNNNTCENYHFNEWVEGEEMTVLEQKALTGRGDTTNYQYERDVKSKKPRAHEWHWEDTSWQYTDDCGCLMPVPASRGAKPVRSAKHFTGGNPPGREFAQMFVRGFAYVQAASYLGSVPTGNDVNFEDAADGGSNDGIARGGDVEETVVVAAVIQWLSGKIHGYTDRSAANEVKADWCNGNVAMTGTSYDGTLSTAAAISGVEGIKAVIPQAPPISYYEYYRSNGGTMQAVQEQGSDNSWCSAYIIPPSGEKRLDFPTNAAAWNLLNIFNETMAHYAKGEDRHSGDYNQFWDTRNFLVDVPQAKAGILLQHGFMDYNVEIVQSDMLYRALKKNDANYPVKMMLHQQNHTGVTNAYVDGPTIDDPMSGYELVGRWLDYFCWGIDNGILAPDVPNIWAVNNITGEWDGYSDWPIPDVEDTKYFLTSAAGDAGGRLTTGPTTAAMAPVKDVLRDDVMTRLGYEEPGSRPAIATPENPGGNDRTRRKGRDQIRGDIWQDMMIRSAGFGAHSASRLAFITAPFDEETLLSGTPTVTLELKADMGKGTVSVAIVDVGEVRRGITYPFYNSGNTFNTETAGTIPAIEALGLAAQPYNRYVPRTSGEGLDITDHYYVISRGSVDLQNPNPSGLTHISPSVTVDTGLTPPYYYQTKNIQPGDVNTYTFTMHPAHYRFRPGTQLAVYVYTADYRYSTIPDIDRVAVSLNLGSGTYINLPLDKALPAGAPASPSAPLSPAVAATAAANFRTLYAAILAETATTVEKTDGTTPNNDRAAAVTALDAYFALPAEVKALLVSEKAKLDELLNAITDAEFERRANVFKTENAAVLAMSDTSREAAWGAWSKYKGLNIGAKSYLTAEKNLLLSLLVGANMLPAQTVAVTYHLNGGTGTVPVEGIKASGATFVAAEATGITNSGGNFLGWNTAADGSGKTYAPGATVLVQGVHDINLYAKYDVATTTQPPVTTTTPITTEPGGDGGGGCSVGGYIALALLGIVPFVMRRK